MEKQADIRILIACHKPTYVPDKNVNIKFDIFSCFYCFAVLHNT